MKKPTFKPCMKFLFAFIAYLAIYQTGFGQCGVTVIDNNPGSPTYNNVIGSSPAMGPFCTVRLLKFESGTDISSGITSGSTKYSWTSSPVGFKSSSRFPTVSPTITTTYYLAEKDSIDTFLNCSTNIVIEVFPPAQAGSGQLMCPPACDTCIKDSAIIGGITPQVFDTFSTYIWSKHRKHRSLKDSVPFFNERYEQETVSPSVTTTYYLEKINSYCNDTTYDTVVVTVGIVTATAGTAPGGTKDGWYARPLDCSTPPTYDIEIWGDSTTYGRYSITDSINQNHFSHNFNKHYFYINCGNSSKRKIFYDTSNAIIGTIHSITIDSGTNTKLSWVPNTNANLQIYSAWRTPTIVTLAGVTNLSLTANAPYQLGLYDSSPRVPTIIISPPAYNNTFNQIEINGYAVPVKDAASHFSYIAAEMNGAFSFKPDSTNGQLIIEEGCELFLNGSNSKGFGCTLQSTNKYKGWGGIKIDGSQYWFAGPLASQVINNSWPYAPLADSVDGPGYRGQGIGALYAKNAKIINADSCTSGYGINVGYQYTNSADNQGSAVFIAEGTTFVNSSINFWGPDSSLWVDRGKTHKITDTGRNQNVSYFKNDSFVNSTVTLNNINFAINSQPTFQGCTFTGKNSAKGALGNLYSYFSTFSAYNNTFIKCDTGMYILGGIFQQDIEENNFNCVNIGLRAISTKNLFAFQNNFIIKGAGTDTSYGLRMENCPYLYAFNNNFIGAGGNSVGLLAYKNSGASLIRYNYFTSLYIGAMNLALNPKIQYHCNIFSKNTKTIS